CPRQFTRLYNLKSHEPIHSNARPYTCPHEGCTLSFLRKHDCKRHYESLHLSEEAKRFKWYKVCGTAFARCDALRRH
ncbi:hypothetical protein BC832DRAFT_521503, partial [Gaertneriomyces semiglobifer]